MAAVLPWVLGDPGDPSGIRSGSNHPVLTWMQTHMDGADAVTFGRLALLEPPPSSSPHHLFQVMGQSDTYADALVQGVYAAATGVEFAAHDPSVTDPAPIGYPPLQPLGTPLSGNVTVSGTPYTAAVRQYAPSGADDGHFVVFDLPSALADADRFLGGALGATMPRVGP